MVATCIQKGVEKQGGNAREALRKQVLQVVPGYLNTSDRMLRRVRKNNSIMPSILV